MQIDKVIRTRGDIEQLEEETMAGYAMKSRDSEGRKYKEELHPIRTCYQRDRDRIVHCSAFRRLEYKTQVFIIFEGDYYRTRLTHTIEVAQIGRTIGRSLRLNEDLIEAIALAHDLGHPPFGHAGEAALNAKMKEIQDGEFNHNKHSYDIVSKYEKRYPDFDGLNLTSEVCVGILKHETKYDHPSVTDAVLKQNPTVEAQVVDLADSLAYLNHDIDDGLKSGCIVAGDLMESDLWQKAMKNISGTLKEDDPEMMRYQIVKELIDMQIKDLIQATSERLGELDFKSSRDVKNFKGTIVCFSPGMGRERDDLQDLLNNKLYHHHRVVRMTSKAKRIISRLFDAYLNEPYQLPGSVYEPGREYSERDRYEIICSYIAKMTDRAALDEYNKLFDPYTKV